MTEGRVHQYPFDTVPKAICYGSSISESGIFLHSCSIQIYQASSETQLRCSGTYSCMDLSSESTLYRVGMCIPEEQMVGSSLIPEHLCIFVPAKSPTANLSMPARVGCLGR